MRAPKRTQNRSQFSALENHFLNTFFSGLYISATDLLQIAKEADITIQMDTREQLIKELLNRSFDANVLDTTMMHLSRLIDERIGEYQQLSMNYPNANAPLKQLLSKANATKALLARECRGSVYD